MRVSTLFPFAVLVITGVSASIATTPFAEFSKRQINSPVCTDQCQAVMDEAAACSTDIACICKSSVIDGLVECAQCTIRFDPNSGPALQEQMDVIAEGCKTAGFDVGNTNINGGNTGGSGSSASTSRISSASVPTTVSALPSATRITSAIVTSTSSAARSGGSTDNSGGSGGLGTPNGAATLKSSMIGVVVGIGAIFAGVL